MPGIAERRRGPAPRRWRNHRADREVVGAEHDIAAPSDDDGGSDPVDLSHGERSRRSEAVQRRTSRLTVTSPRPSRVNPRASPVLARGFAPWHEGCEKDWRAGSPPQREQHRREVGRKATTSPPGGDVCSGHGAPMPSDSAATDARVVVEPTVRFAGLGTPPRFQCSLVTMNDSPDRFDEEGLGVISCVRVHEGQRRDSVSVFVAARPGARDGWLGSAVRLDRPAPDVLPMSPT